MRDSSARMTYTVEETAVVLGVSRSTMYELIASGSVASVRLGRRIVVLRPTIEQLLGCPPPPPVELAAILQRRRLRPIDTAPAKPAPRARHTAAANPRLFG